MSYHVNRQLTTNMKKRHDPILGTIPPHNFPDNLIVVHFASVKLRNEITSSSKSVMKLIWVLLVTALALLQPFSSNAARKVQRGKFVVKQITNKLKTVCPSQNKNLSQVLSIVSSVDLTLRFTHSRISSLESAAKRMKKANAVLLHRLGKMDRKLDGITKMIRKVANEEKPRSIVICEHKKANITCKKGEKINIVQANYGRLNKRACTKSPIRSTNCRAAKSLAVVKSTCHKKASCALHASNKVFGDPCKGIVKYLLVKYKCER
ncbi:uncharacterized protein LOC110053617 [Orbicella faveolata]|uniref:uncharacterized protein LOC110053617 n=1 Tax=Orbicella faveolata TaxID=48498 RepID=UPI0009E46ACB|nr:uncharacterized protein LOC110053617 [Orbicella faveolata]